MPPFNVSSVNDPMKAARFRVTNPSRPEDLYQPLYDRVNYAAAGTTQISFFATQLGQQATLIRAGVAAAVNKTKRDTNLDTSGVIPTKLFQFIGISLCYIPLQQVSNAANTEAIGDDIMRLKYGGWIDFKIIDKPIIQIPNHMIPETNPITSAATTENVSTVFSSGAQSSVGVPMYKLPIPITLNPFESFTVQMNFDGTVTLTQTFDIMMVFHAFMRRPT